MSDVRTIPLELLERAIDEVRTALCDGDPYRSTADRLKRLIADLESVKAAEVVNPRLEYVLKGLRGHRESFRAILLDKDKLLAQFCDYAAFRARRIGVEPWSIIARATSHGSGVSAAIYELYRSNTAREGQKEQ